VLGQEQIARHADCEITGELGDVYSSEDLDDPAIAGFSEVGDEREHQLMGDIAEDEGRKALELGADGLEAMESAPVQFSPVDLADAVVVDEGCFALVLYCNREADEHGGGDDEDIEEDCEDSDD
jgi:hypothetical protein